MNDLYENGQLKERLDCKNYILDYFIPTTKGTHVLNDCDALEILQKDTFKEVYLKRFPKDIQKWYNTETVPKKLICDINKPTVGDTFINVSEKILHEYKKYSDFSEDIKVKVNIMLDFIKLVWASNDDNIYNFLLKWQANMIKGNKNSSCIYVKGDEGIGKSTLADFLRDYVIGIKLFVKGKADHLKGQHNMQLLGKLFCVFEELQFFSEAEWRAVDSELKDVITSNYMSYVDKYEKRFDAENFCNFMVLTNFNAIKGANGRRYMALDMNVSKMNDFKYFDYIRNNCFNKEVGEAFFSYLYEIDTSNFNSLDIPITKSKRDLCADLISPLEKFLKFNYLLRNKSINMKVVDLFKLYLTYANEDKRGAISAQEFCKQMRNLGFEHQLLHGYNRYKVPLEDLKEIAVRKKWLHELDKDLMEKDDDEENDYVMRSEHNELKAEYDELKAKYDALVKSPLRVDIKTPKKKLVKKFVTPVTVDEEVIYVSDNVIGDVIDALGFADIE